MFKIIPNPNEKLREEIKEGIKLNDGYCTCKILRTEDNKCPCKEFKETKNCECLLYVKEEESLSERTRGFEVIKAYEQIKDEINLPKRSTANSAGNDFEACENVTIPSIWEIMIHNISAFLLSGSEYKAIKPTLVPTGIKAYMPEDEMLGLYNRSGNPKKGLVLANGVGVVDSDYYGSPETDGHIMFAFYNFFPFSVEIKKGDKIGQGVFQKFLKADNDNADGDRVGGFGSTNNQ